MPRTTKTGSKSERDVLRQEMLVRGCSTELIAREMERRWGFRAREAQRHAHGWSQDEVAARYTEIVDRLGGDRAAALANEPGLALAGRLVPAPMIGTRIGEYERWPLGGRRPSTYVLTVLAAVFGTTVDRLLDYDDYRNMPEQERTVLASVLNCGVSTGGGSVPLSGGYPPARVLLPGLVPGTFAFDAARAGRLLAGSSFAGQRGADLFGEEALERATAEAADSEEAVLGAGLPAAASGARPPAATAAGWPRAAASAGPSQGALALANATVGLAAFSRPADLAGPLHLDIPMEATAQFASDAALLARRRRRDRVVDTGGAPPAEEEVIMKAAGQSAEFGEWAEATNIGPTALEQFDQDIRDIARAYLHSPPLPLLLATVRIRNRAFTLIEGRQYPNQTSQLYLIAGRLCGLLAWMSGDLGRHADAETQARTGWLCAELADNSGLRAWVRATQSKLAYWEGRTVESAQLAEDGQRYGASDSARVILPSLAARAWARVGDASAAHAALDRVGRERDGVRDRHDDVGGLYGFSEAQQYYLAGTTHLWLGEPAAALHDAERAVWLYQTGDPTDRFYGAESIALIDAASAYLLSDELAGATDRLAPVLALPPSQRLETFTVRLTEMADALGRSRYAGSSEAVELQNRIEDFRAGALSRNLRQ